MRPRQLRNYRVRRLESLGARVRRLWRRLSGGPYKAQRVYRVRVGEVDAKRIVVSHASEAKRLEASLDALRPTRLLPAVIARYRNELWVEYLEGLPLPGAGPPPVAALAELLGILYAQPSRCIEGQSRELAEPVERNLELLERSGVIDSACRSRLRDRADAWSPDRAWLGYDYLDLRRANLLEVDGGLRLIDVESVVSDELLGTGAARAWLRWPGLERSALLKALARPEVPDFEGYADFLELRFLSRWTLRCLLQRKAHLVEPTLFQMLAQRA